MTAVKQPKLPLPEYLMVLGVRFRVEMVDTVDTEDGAAVGETNGELRVIRIAKSQDSRRQWTTLFHEFMHAVLHVIGYANESIHEVEEMIVQSSEHAVEQFMLAHGESYLKALEAQK